MSNVGFVFTVALLAGTLWLAATRFRLQLENNWPLLYYFGAVIHLHSYPGVLNPYVVYVAVICALLLRFEFMNERLVTLVRLVEVACLVHMSWAIFGAVWKEFR
ncbi:MAG: hypothetical protein ACPL7M_03415 [Bryobacteraceae bacterium]